VELETDCQAVRDVLWNPKLNATHSRWKESVLGHHIVDIRHRPGKTNKAADGISRQYSGLPQVAGDGHEWTVSEDWEAASGLSHDLFLVAPVPDHEVLLLRFKDEPMYLSIIEALLERDHGKSVRDKKRARHRAKEYMIEGGKLWRVADGRSPRARARLECVTQPEMVDLAQAQHEIGGHYGRDMVKLKLMDKYSGTRVDKSVVTAINGCGRCKNFGASHIHSLLEPITRRHPFELFVADYLSMSMGIGGYHTIALVMDVFTRFRWGFKLKTKGTAKSTVASLQNVCNMFSSPESLMTDGGSHFDCKAVRDFCAQEDITLQIISPYSPWIAGLIENGNSNLLSILRRLCAPNLGEDDYETMQWVDLPKNWPIHFDDAIRILNNRLMPSLQCSPAELMFGLVINTVPTPVTDSGGPVSVDQIGIHQAYVQQQRLDGYGHTVEHAVNRKAVFDERILRRHPREVVFVPGQLVQVYRNDLDTTFKSERKLLPRWSAPRRIVGQDRNSYRLVTLEGAPMEGTFSSRRLRRFLPRDGTALSRLQVEKEMEVMDVAVDDVAVV
jgi:transposase InsO family protein